MFAKAGIIAFVVGLFFGLSQFITDLMWYGQLGFQNVVWTSWVSSSACGRRMRC